MTVPVSYGCYKIIGDNAYEMLSTEPSTFKGQTCQLVLLVIISNIAKYTYLFQVY